MTINPELAELYLRFVEERHHVWRRRMLDPDAAPWTGDRVIATKKFTNVYRVLDHGSQFVVRELLYSDSPAPEDALARVFLYRYTNTPRPWEAFKEDFGRYPLRADLEPDGALSQFWQDYKAGGNPIFGSAYKMFVGQENRGLDRLTWVLQHGWRAVGYEGDNIVDRFLEADGPAAKHAVLKTVPRCADFMGLQVLTDWGYYDPTYDENVFVVAGPGSTLGAKEIDPDARPYDMIMWAHEQVLSRPYSPLLGVRPPSWMDVQNTLCEFSKYVRYWRAAPKPTQYRPAHPGVQPPPFLPPHWRAGL